MGKHTDKLRRDTLQGFDIARARCFAQLSNLAYYIPDQNWQNGLKKRIGFHADIEKLARKEGYKLLNTLTTKAMHVAIFSNKEEIVIAFRGTNKYSSFERDRAFSYDQFLGIENHRTIAVHAGCHEALYATVKNSAPPISLQEAIEKEVEKHLTKSDGSQKRLQLTGHSIGGSLAVLCTEDMLKHHRDWRVDSLYTFGQPRVGNPAFAEHISNHSRIDGGYWRVVMAKDPIPLLPGKYARGRNHKTGHELPNYKHGGTPVMLDKRSNDFYHRSSTKSVQERLKKPDLIEASRLWMQDTFAFYRDFPQHTLSNYCKTLQKISEKQRDKGRDGA